MPRIHVIGAGVIGLTTALELQKAGHSVKIIASSSPSFKYDNSLYTSPKAGAHWRSTAGQNKIQQKWDRFTFKIFWKMSTTHPFLITRLHAMDLWKVKPSNWARDWFHDLVPNYSEIPKSLLPNGVTFGMQYETISIDTRGYLEWLQNEFLRLGGTLQEKSLAHIDKAFDSLNVNTVINCTGLGSSTLGGVRDTNVYPTRGQLVIVKQDPLPKVTITRLDDFIYCIPRPDGTIALGGTYQEYNLDPIPNLETAERILKANQSLLKELSSSQFVSHSVGFRPTRVGGVRLETESHPKGRIIHNYGHGGMGYQCSWGCAHEVQNLLRK